MTTTNTIARTPHAQMLLENADYLQSVLDKSSLPETHPAIRPAKVWVYLARAAAAKSETTYETASRFIVSLGRATYDLEVANKGGV